MDKCERMKELHIEATTDNLAQVTAFVDEILEAAECPVKHIMPIELSVEEIYVNIAQYAYAPGTGDVTIRAGVGEDRSFTITFMDSGVPYDPLAKEDPDVTLSADERSIGGLGVYLTKQFMDDVSYVYKDGKNTLMLVKNIG